MQKVRNVFETILKYGHDEDFAPGQSRTNSARPMLLPVRTIS